MSNVGLIRWVLIGCVSFFWVGVVDAEELSPHLQELTEKAEQGDAKAKYMLGIYYCDGIGVAPDKPKGLQLMEESADQIGMQEAMGHYYDSTKDFEQAVKWYAKAAERGYPISQYKLGFMYLLGKGVQQAVG